MSFLYQDRHLWNISSSQKDRATGNGPSTKSPGGACCVPVSGDPVFGGDRHFRCGVLSYGSLPSTLDHVSLYIYFIYKFQILAFPVVKLKQLFLCIGMVVCFGFARW